MSENAANVPELEYAPGAPIRRRKRIWRVWLLISLSIAGIMGLVYGPSVVRQAQILYYQRQCLNYTVPADTVIFDSHPDNARELLKNSGADGFVSVSFSFPMTSPVGAGRVPPKSLVEFDRYVPRLNFGTPLSEPAFMHERISRDGTHKLVIVPPECLFTTGLASIIEPADWLNSGHVQLWQASAESQGLLFYLRDIDIRIYAGQIDPADSSHFTITYEVNGEKGLVDGYLKDIGTVQLIHRFGPATRPGRQQLPPPDYKPNLPNPLRVITPDRRRGPTTSTLPTGPTP